MENIFELEFGEGHDEGTYSVRVLRSVMGGEPTGTVALDVAELLNRRPLIEANILSSSVSTRRTTPAVEQPLRDIGQLLFQSVFTGPVAGAYRASLGVARERGDALQVALRLNAPGLAALPWETLYDPEIGAYLSRKEPLIRHIAAPFTPDILEVKPPLRVLGMVASPRGLPLLDVEAERTQLQTALQPHLDSGRVQLVWLDDVSWVGVHTALLEQPWHVLHFVGHGGYDTTTDEGVLAFVGSGGRADYVDASRLADLLDEAEPTPRLVVLNSCASAATGAEDVFSGTAAALVRSGIHAVAAMQFAISDNAAIAFSRGFYTALAHGRGVDDAVRSGRIGILGTGRGTLEWVTPVLYLRGGGPHLFALTPQARSDPPRRPHAPTGHSPSAGADPTGPAPADHQDTYAPTSSATASLPISAAENSHGGARVTAQHRSQRRLQEPRSGEGRRWSRRQVTAGGVLVSVAIVVSVVVVLLRSGDAGAPGTGAGAATSVISTVQRTIPSTQVWTDMDLPCNTGDTVEIAVSGTVMHEDSPTGKVGPAGLTDPFFHQWNVPGLPNANTVAVIGSLDQALPFFVVGHGTTYSCPRNGELYLGVNDVGVANNTGQFTATITKSRRG